MSASNPADANQALVDNDRRHQPSRADQVLGALPAGSLEAARSSLHAALSLIGSSPPTKHWLSERWIGEQLVAPLLLGDNWPEPTAPLMVSGGAVHADLTDDDHELFAGLRQTLASRQTPLDAERLAAAAQELRLAVTPYRRLAPRPTTASVATGPVTGGTGEPPAGPTGPGRQDWPRTPLVVDLSSLWAGPLATSLLADLGAEVIKVDPDCRPDGLRTHGQLYQRLNGAKTIIDLDLRQRHHRSRFEALLAEADLVVDSFSRRVMPNFGYGPGELQRLHPRLSTLSIVAFPAGSREQDWVSYGPGVHAISGLADPGPSGRFHAAPIAYPDALAGLAAFAAAADLLTTDRRPADRRPADPAAVDPLDGGRSQGPAVPGDPNLAHGPCAGVGRRHREISLAGSLQPLIERAHAAREAVEIQS